MRNTEFYGLFSASCREINRFSVSKIGPEPAKLMVSLALVPRQRVFHLSVPRLAGKYRWWEFPAVIPGNYRPGKYSRFCQSGKYWEIQNFYSCFSTNILSYCYKFKLNEYFSFHLSMYYVNKNINTKTVPYQKT